MTIRPFGFGVLIKYTIALMFSLLYRQILNFGHFLIKHSFSSHITISWKRRDYDIHIINVNTSLVLIFSSYLAINLSGLLINCTSQQVDQLFPLWRLCRLLSTSAAPSCYNVKCSNALRIVGSKAKVKEPKDIKNFNLDWRRLGLAHDVCLTKRNSVATCEGRKHWICVQKEH